MITRLVFSIAVIVSLASCQSKPEGQVAEGDTPEEARYHQAGLVMEKDLKFAKEWETLIHENMVVRSQKIEVQPGPGYTSVTIRELKNRADAESIAQGLRDFAEKNKQRYGNAKVTVSLNNAPTTINPFSLPTESSPAIANPGSVLPTISLPPFQPSGR